MNERMNEMKETNVTKETNETIIGSKELILAPENKESHMTEIPELRGENRKVFRLKNKEQQAVFYPAPVHVFNEETQMYEEAADILTEEQDDKGFTCRRNHFAVNFCKAKESDRLFTMESGVHKVTVLAKMDDDKSRDGNNSTNILMEKSNTKDSKDKIDTNVGKGIVPKKARKEQLGKKKDVLTFADVKAGTDYEYSVAGYGVKENIIVKEKAKDYRYSFILQCEHVTPQLVEEENRIVFLSNDTGEEIFFIPAPFMTDAKGEVSTDVSYELIEKTTGVVQLTVIADSDWMNDESRVFPVTIDPQINLSGSEGMTTYSWRMGIMSNASLHTIGYKENENGSRGINRMYMDLNMPSLPRNPRIKKAELSFAQNSIACTTETFPKIGLYSVTEEIKTGLSTPANSTDLIDFAVMKTGTGEEGEVVRYSFDITTLVDEIAKDETSSRGLVLKLLDENVTDNNHVILYGSGYEEDYAPQLVITYESGYGINTSYRTHTHELGSFGQGSIDLACGNLMFDFGDFTWSGNRMPLTIRHLYNSALFDQAYTYHPSVGLNLPDYGSMKLGHGFKLSLMQSVRPISQTMNGEQIRYVYTDEKGEESYFKLGTKKKCCPDNSQCYDLYENVDGGDMFYDPYEFTLEKGDELYKFDMCGKLLSITDNSSRTLPDADVVRSSIEITYNDRSIASVRDGAGRIFAFNYDDDGFLTSIEAPDETRVSYTYSGDLLSSITYQDGRKAEISYAEDLPSEVTLYDADGNSVYRMVYTFEGDRIASVTEYGKRVNGSSEETENTEESLWEMGVSNSYTYSAASGKTTVLTTEPKDEEEGEESDTVTRTVYAFDDEGNVVSEYAYLQDMGNTGVEGNGSGIHPYAGNGGASVITNSINLLKNHSFEEGEDGSISEWTAMPGNADDFEVKKYSYGYFGTHLLRMQSNNADSVANGVYQTTEELPAGSYTYSAYLKPVYEICGNVSQGAYIRVSLADGTILAKSEHLAKKEGDYVRLFVPFELTTAQAVNVEILMDGLGLLYVDGVQLENKSFASPYNLLEDGTFERRDSWTGIADETYTDEDSFNGDYSMKVTGNLEGPRYVSQYVNVHAQSTTRETFTLSGWAKGYGLPDHEREDVANAPRFQLRAEIYYESSDEDEEDVESFTADFSPCTDEWQYASVEFAKSKCKKVKSVKVYCDYGYNTGVAYFDNIQLVRTNLETGLSASDFTWADADDTEDETEGIVDDTYTTPSFEEAEDAYGNALTETVFSDGEFGTIYRSLGYNTGSAMSEDEEGNTYLNTGNDLVRETDARGNVTTYLVDDVTSRNKAVIDRCGNKTSYEYDEAGKITKVISAMPQYHENGEKVTDEEGEVIYEELANVSYSYDAFDNMTEILRGDGMKYALGYNAFHNLENIGIEGKNEPLVKYNYKNGNGRLKAITYANGHTMKATYNSAGQMTSEKWFETESQAAALAEDETATSMAHYKYVYDGQGNIVRSIDVLGEKEYNYSYENGRLLRATECDITSTGEIVTAKTVVHTIRYYYDSEGQMTRKVIAPTGGEEQVIFYETDDSNTVVKFKAGDKTVTSHSKSDSFGRKVFDELQLGTGFVSRQFSYHIGEVPDEHKKEGKLKSSPTTQLVSNIVFSDGRTLSYEYDEEERITKVTDKFNDEETVTEYSYDALGQLLTETSGGKTIKYEYDNYGNITVKGECDESGEIAEETKITYDYDETWKDMLISYNGQSISYDTQGNPINYLGHTLTWEKGRQLKQFVKDDGTVIDYTYNANGIRTSKTIRDVETGEEVTHTYTLDGTKILRETWNQDGENHSIVPMYDNEDSVCGIQYNGEPYYFQKNLQGDVIAIVDKEVNTVARYSYDAWGVCNITQDTSECGIATINPYRYRGYYFDVEIEMYYLQSRYYNPMTERFINADASEYSIMSVNAVGHNLFAYCNNNPVNFIDPTGHIAIVDDAFFLAFIGLCALLMALLAWMSTPAFRQSWNSFCTAVGNGLSWIGTSIVDGGKVVWSWTVSQVKTATAAITTYIDSVRADIKIKNKVKRNSKSRYWTATLKKNYVDIGRAISYGTAVSEVSKGRNVFTVTSSEAKAVAKAAYSNKKPVGPEIDKGKENVFGYYYHYHVNNRRTKGHVFFLFW